MRAQIVNNGGTIQKSDLFWENFGSKRNRESWKDKF